MQVDLSGKVAIVTGASAGIGKGIALKLAENGAKVVIVSRGADTAAKAVAEIEAKGGAAVHEAADISEYAQVDEMVRRVLQRWAKIDILAVSGGTSYTPRPFLEIDPLTMQRLFDRFWNRIICARAVVDQMVRQKYGKIIFLTTDAGRTPTYSETLNGAGAAALMYFTRCLASEVARHGVRVYAIATTLTKDTPGWDRYIDRRQAHSSDAIQRVFLRVEDKVAFRINSPEDLGNLALFLASGESDQISGATISISGGLSFPG